MATIAQYIRARAGDPRVGLRFDDEQWTWAEYVQACAERAALLEELRRPGPYHVGVLMDNTPEFSLWLGAAALVGAVVVGINPTRRGAELALDITHTDCQLIVTEERHRALLAGLDLGIDDDRIQVVDSDDYAAAVARHRGAPIPEVEIDEKAIYLLLFTSGTTGAPKACIVSQARLARSAGVLADAQELGSNDVCYQVMPLFHSNALITGWAPCLIAGATAVLRRRFSASGFLPDVRKYSVTYFNYVGKPLSYILATPEQPDDADNTLRRVFGNEGADLDLERFAVRFGCKVTDGYGSTESAASISRDPAMPKGSLGRGPEGTAILDPETGRECVPAEFDDEGRLLNPEAAIGEIVNKKGAPAFEGYYKNEEANQARVHDGIYWTGDLGYRDNDGWFYFAGRDFEWLRVDGENFAAAPVERIIARYPGVLLAAVYAVPDEEVGDQVMAALQLVPGTQFDPAGFDAFLADQADLGTKWSPRYVRVAETLPMTETSKVLKRSLRRERWETSDPVWWRPRAREPLRPMSADDITDLRERFAARNRLAALDA